MYHKQLPILPKINQHSGYQASRRSRFVTHIIWHGARMFGSPPAVGSDITISLPYSNDAAYYQDIWYLERSERDIQDMYQGIVMEVDTRSLCLIPTDTIKELGKAYGFVPTYAGLMEFLVGVYPDDNIHSRSMWTIVKLKLNVR